MTVEERVFPRAASSSLSEIITMADVSDLLMGLDGIDDDDDDDDQSDQQPTPPAPEQKQKHKPHLTLDLSGTGLLSNDLDGSGDLSFEDDSDSDDAWEGDLMHHLAHDTARSVLRRASCCAAPCRARGRSAAPLPGSTFYGYARYGFAGKALPKEPAKIQSCDCGADFAAAARAS